jgi:surfeit locus 1 family protein
LALVIAHRTFAPRLWSTLGALALIAAGIALGRWQLARADYKRHLFAEFAAGTDATLSLSAAGTKSLPRYQHVGASGHFDGARQVVLDNMTHDEQAGFRVLTPFELDDGRLLLVDRGWFALGRTRTDWPALELAATARTIRGRLDKLPVPGIRLAGPGAEAMPTAWPKLMNYPAWPELEAAYGRKLYPNILLLDRDQPDGFTRNWTPPGFGPERHIAYAVQWFALALMVAVLYAVLNLRKESAA